MSALGVANNAFLQAVSENKFSVIVGMFVLSSVSQSLIATGAFEVFVGGEKVFSKLEKGRMPSVPELIDNLSKLGYDYN
jgi:selT/selW/selH-like putative selenoprotein